MESPLVSTYGNRINRFLTSANDFHNERHRINKRLAKLRVQLSLKNKNTKNYKKHIFTNEDYLKEPKIGDLILLSIERDVLYALETKIVIEVQSSKSKEKFISSKYKKAISNLKFLLSIIDDDDKNKLQIYIYAAVIQGSYSLFKRRWEQATYSYSLARVGLQSLLAEKHDDNDLMKQVFVEMIDNVIDPSLKLSLYNSSHKQSSSPNLNQISKVEIKKSFTIIPYLGDMLKFIDDEYLEQEDENMNKITEITWSKYTASINDDDTSRLLLIAEKNNDMEHSTPSSYDPALMSWQIVLDHHTLEMEKTNESLSDEEIQDKQILLTFINYKLNLLKIERDLALLEEIDNDDDVNTGKKKVNNRANIKKSLKVLDNILLTLQNIKELPGVYNDENIWKLLECYENYYQIIKINKLSESYLISNQFKESLLLLVKSSSLISTINDDDLVSSPVFKNSRLPNLNDLQKLSNKISKSISKLQSLTEYYSTTLSHNNQYYIEDLKCVPHDMTKLVNIKEFQMVHQKPVLFDIAFNYIDYSNNGSDEVEITEKGEKKKSFFGLFGGSR